MSLAPLSSVDAAHGAPVELGQIQQLRRRWHAFDGGGDTLRRPDLGAAAANGATAVEREMEKRGRERGEREIELRVRGCGRGRLGSFGLGCDWAKIVGPVINCWAEDLMYRAGAWAVLIKSIKPRIESRLKIENL